MINVTGTVTRDEETDRVNIRRVTVGGALTLTLLGVPAALAACGIGGDDYATTSVAEDCDLEDQRKHEDDCGYWSNNRGEYLVGSDLHMDATWFWVWWTWVQVGRVSHAPSGWRAPYNLKSPTRTVRVPRKNCALGAGNAHNLGLLAGPPPPRPAPVRVAPPPPAPRPNPPARVNPPGGGSRVNNPPPAPKPPVYKPPAGMKVRCS